MNVSERGRKMILGFEGVVTAPYVDVAGVPTVCAGHVIRPEDAPILADGVTSEDCDALLSHDLAGVEADIAQHVKVLLTQDQYDALASWDFNTGALRSSTLLVKLNAGDYSGAADEFERWCKRRDPRTGALVVDQGLLARRRSEAALFRRGIDHQDPVPDLVWRTAWERVAAEAARHQFDLAASLDLGPSSRDRDG